MVYTEFKLFVGGLSWDTDTEGLRAAFSPFGEVAFHRVCSDQETGNSRGFGFVSFTSEAEGASSRARRYPRASVRCIICCGAVAVPASASRGHRQP